MHSTYSDGRDAARVDGRGLPSRSATSTWPSPITRRAPPPRGRWRASDVARQRDEIEELRERYPRMTILHGIEVDILPDGRLDFDDAILEQFDIVLASLHDHARQDRRAADAAQPRRDPASARQRALPSGQPAGRTLRRATRWTSTRSMPRRSRPARRSRSTGRPVTWISTAARARAAAAAGVTLTIDSDCHRVRGARPTDALRRRDRAARVGRATPRAQYPAAGRAPCSSSPPSAGAGRR